MRRPRAASLGWLALCLLPLLGIAVVVLAALRSSRTGDTTHRLELLAQEQGPPSQGARHRLAAGVVRIGFPQTSPWRPMRCWQIHSSRAGFSPAQYPVSGSLILPDVPGRGSAIGRHPGRFSSSPARPVVPSIFAGTGTGVVYAGSAARAGAWRPISPSLGGNPIFSLAFNPKLHLLLARDEQATSIAGHNSAANGNGNE